ncbi:hypothetical protein [Leifsonia aquatica]|uniref:hypothetical protein n=1 Tax=Leifsonia aquatica TaxID=144185 RepID=UPI0028A6A7F4|nr:hypothetical protein [Leifsonia aquatica]
MIYTVECGFAAPEREDEWNRFYSDVKLPALISVTGFASSQRFRAITAGCPGYLAVHTVDSLDVLNSAEYREKGGGTFAQWQSDITDWRRNLYEGPSTAPGVHPGQNLVLSSAGPESIVLLGLAPTPMRAIAMERWPERRWMATVESASLPELCDLAEDLAVYVPMTPQLTPPRATASLQRS